MNGGKWRWHPLWIHWFWMQTGEGPSSLSFPAHHLSKLSQHENTALCRDQRHWTHFSAGLHLTILWHPCQSCSCWACHWVTWWFPLGLLHMRWPQSWFIHLRLDPVHHRRHMVSIPPSVGSNLAYWKSPHIQLSVWLKYMPLLFHPVMRNLVTDV